MSFSFPIWNSYIQKRQIKMGEKKVYKMPLK